MEEFSGVIGGEEFGLIAFHRENSKGGKMLILRLYSASILSLLNGLVLSLSNGLKRLRGFSIVSSLVLLAGCTATNYWQSIVPDERMRQVGWSEGYRKQIEGRLIFLDVSSDARALRLVCQENIFTDEVSFLYVKFIDSEAIDATFYFCRGGELIYPQRQETEVKWHQCFLNRLGNEELEGLPEPVKEKIKAALRFTAAYFASRYP